MKFSVITTIALAATVLAAPVAVIEERGAVADAITGIVTTLQTTVTTASSDIKTLVSSVGNSITAQLQIIAKVNADWAKIQSAINTAAGQIIAVTNGAVGGVLGAAAALTQAEIDTITADLKILQGIISGLGVTATATVTGLAPALQGLLGSETAAITALLTPLTNPLLDFAKAIQQVQANGQLTVTGLANAVAGVKTILSSLLNL